MKNFVVGLVFIIALSLQVSVSALEISDADIFITPKSPASNYFGGYIGGIDTGSLDWAIGNTVPPVGRRTRDIVFSVCRGDYAKSSSWTEQFRITQGGPMLMSPDGTRWILSVDNFGHVITTIKE